MPSPEATAAIAKYRQDVATMGADAAHKKLMQDVANTQAEATRGSAAATATLEANDPGSTDPGRTDNAGSIGDHQPMPGVVQQNKAPF